MHRFDLNLLLTLDALLTEESVTRAADRLNLTPPAVSHALGRLRLAFDDPLLVRAGQRLVPTPRAAALRDRVRSVVQQARLVFQDDRPPELARERRTVVIRADDAIVSVYGARLSHHVHGEAPGVQLRFMGRLDEGPEPLRNGTVDLDIGVEMEMAPEISTEQVCEMRFVVVSRADHPLASVPVSAAAYAAATHVVVSRRGRGNGPIDRRLAEVGLARRVPIIVPDAMAALAVVAGTDHLATVPLGIADWGRATMRLASFRLPVTVPDLAIFLSWHPRLDRDPVHRWIRACLRRAFA